MDDGRRQTVIVVDSSVWIDHFRDRDVPHVRRFREIENLTEVLVGDVILLEILRGARNEAHAARLEREIRLFRTMPFLTADLSVKAARNYRFMRSRGATIRKAVDLIIGSYCLENDHQVLHNDRDFDVMVDHLGLKVA